jgi:hypothetical protein
MKDGVIKDCFDGLLIDIDIDINGMTGITIIVKLMLIK